MAHEFITPNWHALLLHFPIALILTGVLAELVSFGWRRGGFRAAGRWMILLGALLSIPTAMAGIYAFRDVVTPGPMAIDQHWVNVVEKSPWTDMQWEFMTDHIWHNSVAVVIFLLVSVLWLASSDDGRRSLYWPLLIALLVGVGFMIAGAWHGGEAVYRYGTAVGLGEPEVPAGEAARDIRYYVPPLQLHTVLAGLAVAFAVGAFGVMIRRWAIGSAALLPVEIERRQPVAPGVAEPIGSAERSELRSIGSYGTQRVAGESTAAPPRLYPGWLWLGAFLFGILAALAGAWSVMGHFTAEAFEQNVRELREESHLRLLVHVIVGVGIVVTSLLLALIVRVARRWRALPVILSLMLFLFVAAQVWLGVLMMYDSHRGPLAGFASAAEAAEPVQEPAEAAEPQAPREPAQPFEAVPPADEIEPAEPLKPVAPTEPFEEIAPAEPEPVEPRDEPAPGREEITLPPPADRLPEPL